MPLGVAYTLAAYIMWGLFPFYFRLVNQVGPFEILAHRIVWSMVLIVLVLLFIRKWDWLKDLRKRPKVIGVFTLSSLLLAVNWGTYVYAIVHGWALEASLGYFINPLMSVALGAIFLKEKLTRPQMYAIGLAIIAVLWIILSTGSAPWLGLIMALSFALYGLVRKIAPLGSVEGFALETSLMTPIALMYLAVLFQTGDLYFAEASASTKWLLVAAGPVTTIPLILFAFGVRMIPYSTVGIIQYISPTIVFLIGIFYFKEPFSLNLFLGFSLIWIAVIIFTVDSLMRIKRRHGVPINKEALSKED